MEKIWNATYMEHIWSMEYFTISLPRQL